MYMQACIHMVTCIFFLLNNYALFLIYLHLLLSSSLCLSFPPQYDFCLRIRVPLSTWNLLYTEDVNALSILFSTMNTLSYFFFLPYVFFPQVGIVLISPFCTIANFS